MRREQEKCSSSALYSRDAEGKKPIKDFRTSWEKACEAAEVPNLMFHDLRRTARRNMRRAGIPDDVVMKIGGWNALPVARRYDIIDAVDLKDAGRAIEQRKLQAIQSSNPQTTTTTHLQNNDSGVGQPNASALTC